eukprot:TRINITY_DN3445_c0_g2_i1.p1 TRINITY_DN3445_c0_g2~~TRINITY_DN3445_c0_g2_i1.p1  ORF type:complete len:741 (+),score=216.89 TRINITY_DN3445_c0_g2_i1:70-2223(+)
MKIVAAVLLVLGSLSTSARGDKLEGSPVTKVVRMLKDLEEKLEKEADTEKDLYDKFVCWGTSTVDSKTKSIQDAEARIKYLTDYISDITGGKVTFTMNKDELEKEFASIHADILNTTAERKEENAQFVQTQANENEAIAGLSAATKIIQKAAPKTSMLLSLRGAKSSARARLQQAKHLQKALDLGDEYLSKANAVFLRRIITGETRLGAVKGTPAKTDITSQYESRTDGIVRELTKLQESFQKDLKLVQRGEQKQLEAYIKKHKIQEEQEAAVKAALAKLEKEKAAREQAKVQSQEEIDDLTEQNKIDQDLINKIKASMKTKAQEWDQRVTYRQGELKALGEAIGVLTSDEARDAFQASATNFLQVSSTATMRVRLATQALRSVGSIAKDHRLVILASRLTAKLSRHGSQTEKNGTIVNPTFDAVLKKIDDMKNAVETEETSDLATKEKCEADLVNRTAIKTAKERGIENEESTISFSNEKVTELNVRITKVNTSIAEVEEELAAAKKLRDSQNAEFKKAKAEDSEAIRLIEMATKKVTDFYAAQKKSSLLQQPLGDTERAAGGETPWGSAEYTGAGSQASGVTEMMKMVADDIRKDILEAEKDEKESEEDYQNQKKDLESEKSDLETARSNLRVKKAGRTSDLEKAEDSKDDLQGELKAVVQLMADVKPKCDFFLQNYEVRSKNRLTELKGLDKAKAILKGSFFEDKDRELKPGKS